MSRIDLDNPSPSRFQKLRVSSIGHVSIGKYTKPGWSGSKEFYLFLCKKHGYVTSYEKGYNGSLVCPKCFKEDSKK